MKYLALVLFALVSIPTIAQSDSSESPITVVLPKKAVKAFAYYVSESPLALDSFKVVRKLPDYLASIIGSNNQNDSLITITIKAKYLAKFMNKYQSESNGEVRDDYRSVMQNMPSIPSYTALQTQVTAIANGAGPQKKAGQHVRNQFIDKDNLQTSTWAGKLQAGYEWVKDQ